MCTFGTRALSEGPCGELDASRRSLRGITGGKAPALTGVSYPFTAYNAEKRR